MIEPFGEISLPEVQFAKLGISQPYVTIFCGIGLEHYIPSTSIPQSVTSTGIQDNSLLYYTSKAKAHIIVFQSSFKRMLKEILLS